jgi:hypothetical protein
VGYLLDWKRLPAKHCLAYLTLRKRFITTQRRETTPKWTPTKRIILIEDALTFTSSASPVATTTTITIKSTSAKTVETALQQYKQQQQQQQQQQH